MQQACPLTLLIKPLVQTMGQELPPLTRLLSIACSLRPVGLEHLIYLASVTSQKLA